MCGRGGGGGGEGGLKGLDGGANRQLEEGGWERCGWMRVVVRATLCADGGGGGRH